MISPQSDIVLETSSQNLKRMKEPESKKWIWKVPSFERELPTGKSKQAQPVVTPEDPVASFYETKHGESSGTVMIGGLIFAVLVGALTTILALVLGKSVFSAILLGLLAEMIAYLAPILYCFMRHEAKEGG